jgi:hypothetical protein
MPVVTIKLSESEFLLLEEEARKRNKSKSSLLREAFVSTIDDFNPGSAYELASDVIGIAEGPSDLSVNLEHMDGYGRPRRQTRLRK